MSASSVWLSVSLSRFTEIDFSSGIREELAVRKCGNSVCRRANYRQVGSSNMRTP
jgi:hypothetical protein